MALTARKTQEAAPPSASPETTVSDDEVLADLRIFQEALMRSPEDLMLESLKSITRHRQSGTLTADEAETLIRQLTAAAIEARINSAIYSHLLLPTSGTRHKGGSPWRALRSFRHALMSRRSTV